MSENLNYRHLYHFWVVAKQGGVSRAARHLNLAVQTLSVQVRELEKALGVTLLQAEGRRLVLTEAGATAMREADQIFALGEALPQRLRESAAAPLVRLNIGITDGIDKLVVRRSLEPVLDHSHLRLLCHEGELDALLSELAVHRLDAILSDRPAPSVPAMRLASCLLSNNPLHWHAPVRWAQPLRAGFPASLASVPVLLPTRHAAVRERINQWFEQAHVQPRLAGEFEDSALLATFAAGGMGVFPAPALPPGTPEAITGLKAIAPCGDVCEQVHLLYTQRKVMHPLVSRLMASAVDGGGGPQPATGTRAAQRGSNRAGKAAGRAGDATLPNHRQRRRTTAR